MRSLRRRSLPARGRWRAPAVLAVAFALGASAPASAKVQVAPWDGNFAFVTTVSKAGGVTDQQTASPTGPEPWSASPLSSANNDTTNASAFAMMSLATSFKDSIFAVSSTGFGSTSGVATSNSGGSLVYVLFVVDHTQSYIAYPVFAHNNFGSSVTLAFLANMLSKDLAMIDLLPATATTSGRLAPGFYGYFYETYYKDETGSGSPNSASSQVAFFDVPNPLVTQHPQSQTAATGSSVSFSVGTSGDVAASEVSPASASASQSLTFRWRRRYQNLTDGGRISGATTNQLHINSVAVADTGVYDCIVTQGTIQEPSSLARLTVTGTTGVGDTPPPTGLALSTPAPNPFDSRTLVQFTLPRESDVTLDVVDVSGRRVKSLVRAEQRSAGPQSVEWDGRSDRGERAPSGIYFVRLLAGSERRIQRVVRLGP